MCCVEDSWKEDDRLESTVLLILNVFDGVEIRTGPLAVVHHMCVCVNVGGWGSG